MTLRPRFDSYPSDRGGYRLVEPSLPSLVTTQNCDRNLGIELSKVTIHYLKEAHPALDQISINVSLGEIVALLGPNGAGKTSLIKAVCGLIAPRKGSVSVSSIDTSRSPEAARNFLGVLLYPERSFYYRLSGYQNLLFFAGVDGLFGRSAKLKVEELLRRFELWEARKLAFMKFSLGMRKKLALARALLKDPPILLLDEPTDNLDPLATQEILDLVSQLRDEGKAILLATHHLHEAERVADRVAFLKEGRLLAVDTVEALQHSGGTRVLRICLGEPVHDAQIHCLQKIPGVRQVFCGHLDSSTPTLSLELESGLTDLSPLLANLSTMGIAARSVSLHEPSLSDIFCRVVA